MQADAETRRVHAIDLVSERISDFWRRALPASHRESCSPSVRTSPLMHTAVCDLPAFWQFHPRSGPGVASSPNRA